MKTTKGKISVIKVDKKEVQKMLYGILVNGSNLEMTEKEWDSVWEFVGKTENQVRVIDILLESV